MYMRITYVAFASGRLRDYEIRRMASEHPPKLQVSETPSSESKKSD
jgi:hypothetical protein